MKKLEAAGSKSSEQPSESAESSAPSGGVGRKVAVNVVVDRLDKSTPSTGGPATEQSKDEEGKEEPDSLPDVQYRPYSDGSDELHKSKSLILSNPRSTFAKNDN